MAAAVVFLFGEDRIGYLETLQRQPATFTSRGTISEASALRPPAPILKIAKERHLAKMREQLGQQS